MQKKKRDIYNLYTKNICYATQLRRFYPKLKSEKLMYVTNLASFFKVSAKKQGMGRYPKDFPANKEKN